jgi:hypothetical protein
MKIVQCIHTQTKFALRIDTNTGAQFLQSKDGNRIDNFYINLSLVPTMIKTLKKEIFTLSPGEVYIWNEEADKPYHYKMVTKWLHRTNFKKIR